MNTVIEGCKEPVKDVSKFTSEYNPSFSRHRNYTDHLNNEDHGRFSFLDSNVSCEDTNTFADDGLPSSSGPASGLIDEVVAPADFTDDDCLRFITEILMEEDLDDQTAALYDYAAVQAAEKSLYDALGESYSSSSSVRHTSIGPNTESTADELYQSCNSHRSTDHDIGQSTVTITENSPASTLLDLETSVEDGFDWFEDACNAYHSGFNSSNLVDGRVINLGGKEKNDVNQVGVEARVEENGPRGRENLTRDDTAHEGERRNKHSATYDEEYVQMEEYDDVLLNKEDGDDSLSCDCRDGSSDDGISGLPKGYKKKAVRAKMNDGGEEVVDLRSLLTQCAQAVASFDLKNANELLKQIRIHSSQFGDSSQRMSYYFANALEARLNGTGWQQYRDSANKRVTSTEILKAYRMHVSAMPFRRTSYFVANEAVAKLTENATRIHIIDFGIFFGFQWPGLIQKLSKRKSGPPMLRITGIDHPERGFRPARKVEETGRRLAGYCERFKVPFEYQAIAKDWEEITAKEIHTTSDELLVVNCLYMSRKLLDETVDDENNPRDSFLRLIRKLKPDLFIHGIVNGAYGAPFFLTRFREALFHYSAIYDMFEATVPRESSERLLLESLLHGRDVLNALACEGLERVERPETYRQWQVRIQRARFRKMPLDYEVLKRAKAAVKGNFHKDFVIDENSHWMLHGWKGRILYALSCWQSA